MKYTILYCNYILVFFFGDVHNPSCYLLGKSRILKGREEKVIENLVVRMGDANKNRFIDLDGY